MKTGIFSLAVALTLSTALAQNPKSPPSGPAKPDDTRLRTLVQRLGADTFKEREAAQKELSAMPRSVVPVLRQFENTTDPEIKDRLQAAIHAILTDTSRIPQTFHLYTPPTAEPGPSPVKKTMTTTLRTHWLEMFQAWQQDGTIASPIQTNTTSNRSGNFSQGFTAHSTRLTAAAFMLSRSSSSTGWVSLDLRDDNDGRPDSGVLARSWLRMDKNCTAPSGTYAVFPFRDTALDTGKKYWLTLTEHPDESGRHLLYWRYGKSTSPELHLLDRPDDSAVLFLFSASKIPSWLKEPTDEQRQSIPTPSPSVFEWWKINEPPPDSSVQ